MKPSVQQIISAAQQALRDNVAPAVEDQWAASTLRSIDLLLSHLNARTEKEGPMLFEDNRDLVAILSTLPLNLSTQQALQKTLDNFLDDAAKIGAIAYPSVDTLADLNLKGREIVDQLLRICIPRSGENDYDILHKQLRDYLMRHVEREQDFYFPTFVGRPV